MEMIIQDFSLYKKLKRFIRESLPENMIFLQIWFLLIFSFVYKKFL